MDTNKERYDFNDLLEVIRLLRSPDGCPWDREQTHESIKSCLIEETYEVINEIESKNVKGMTEEFGDLLLQVILHSQIASDTGEFDINDVIDGITKKMIFRHPHVFEREKDVTVEEAYDLFKLRKNQEKKYTSQSDILNNIPNSFPALTRAHKLASRLHKIQPQIFDNSVENVWKKVDEEIQELKVACKRGEKNEIEEELGDTIMTLVHLARALDEDSELALNNTCKKVINRIKIIEDGLPVGEKIDEISTDKFKKCWHDAKIIEKNEKM